MLLFLLCLFYLSSFVKVTGYVPQKLKSKYSSLNLNEISDLNITNEFDIHIVEKTHISTVQIDAEPQCSFSEIIPPFNVYKKKGKTNPLISIHENVKGRFTLANHLFLHNFSVSLYDFNATYLIMPSNGLCLDSIPTFYKQVKISKTPFTFLTKSKSEFLVFLGENCSQYSKEVFARQMCEPLSNLKCCYSYIILLFVIITILDSIIFLFNDFKKITNCRLWLLDKKFNVIYGKPLEQIDEDTLYYFKLYVEKAFQRKRTITTVIRLKKKSTLLLFERVVVFPISPTLVFATIWNEIPPENNEMSFDYSFESKTHKIIKEPILSFSSFRDYRPLNVIWTLDNNVRCTAYLPSSVFTPFQPYGEIISLSFSVFSDMINELSQKSFYYQSFSVTAKKFCRKVSIIKRALFFYNNANGYVQYKKANLRKLTNDEILSAYYKGIDMKGWKIIEGFELEKGSRSRCFVSKLIDAVTIFEIDDQDADVFEEIGLPFMAITTIYMFRKIRAYESDFILHECMKLFTNTNKFSFIKIGLESRTLQVCVAPIFDSDDDITNKGIIRNVYNMGQKSLNKQTSKQPKDLDEFLGILGKADTSDLNSIVKEIKTLRKNGGGIIPLKEIRLWINRPFWFRIKVVVIRDNTCDELVAYILAEDITSRKQQEVENTGNFELITKAMKKLGVYKFKIEIVLKSFYIDNNLNSVMLDDKDNDNDNEFVKDIIIESDDFFKTLGRPTDDQEIYLSTIIDKRDKAKFKLLLEGQNISLRLLDANNNSIWYSFSSNGNIGFLFSINSFSTIKSHNITDEDAILTAAGSLLIFWEVDLESSDVNPLFMQPTIWDALSIDRDQKFQRFNDFVHTDDRELFNSNFDSLVRGESDQWTGEIRILRMSGLYEWHRIVLVISNSRKTMYCLALNVHKQKEMENKLAETQKLRDLLLINGKLAIWTFNDDYSPLPPMDSFNPGLNTTVVMNWNFIDKQIHPNYRNIFREKLKSAFETGETLIIDLPIIFGSRRLRKHQRQTTLKSANNIDTFIKESNEVSVINQNLHACTNNYIYNGNKISNISQKSGKRFSNTERRSSEVISNPNQEIWVSLRGKLRNNQQRQIFGLCIDITELRNALSALQLERLRAEEANRQKTVFLANMSHEIRTPMNGIFGLLDVLALQELNSEQRLLVDSVRASSFQLMKLLDETLNLSKIETGEIEMNMTIFNLTKLFEPICIATASAAKLNKLNFNIDIDKMFPSHIYGSSQLLIQIINNLLSNALKFTKQGSITIKFAWTIDNSRELCIIEVSDTGIGISKDQQQIIFEKFQQADPSTQRFFGGTGLGLALVNEIVTFLGGNINVNSEISKGTTFTCSVPMQSVSFHYSIPFSSKKHIIMVSIIDTFFLKSFVDWMTYHHYSVIMFNDPEEIIQYGNCEDILDAIFVETNMNSYFSLKSEKYLHEKDFPKLFETVAKLDKEKQPILCCLCDTGANSLFKYNIATPIIMPQILDFMNKIRFGQLEKQDLSNHTSNIKDVSTPTSELDTSKSSTQADKKKILVVEDNKANQFVMKKILTKIGVNFRIAENGREAINALDEESFYLIFMDCQMPVLDGIEATKIIRASGKAYSQIPIIALTASAVEGDEQTCRNAGMDAYLAKPVRIQQITNIIKEFET